MDAISRLLQPRSVAIIGASADPTKTAGRPVAYLQKHGYAGQILPVNRRRTASATCRVTPTSTRSRWCPTSASFCSAPSARIWQCATWPPRGTAAAIVLASGYTETGEDGARRQRQLLEAAGSMRILGPTPSVW